MTADGSAADFAAAVVTVPLGVLKAGSITFAPALPDEKQDAIDRMGMGLLSKVCLSSTARSGTRACCASCTTPPRGGSTSSST